MSNFFQVFHYVILHTIWVYVIFCSHSGQWQRLYFCQAIITLKAIVYIGKPFSMMLLFWFWNVSAPFFFTEISGITLACLFSSSLSGMQAVAYYPWGVVPLPSKVSTVPPSQTAAKLGYLFIWLLKCNCSPLKPQRGKWFALAPGQEWSSG